MIEIFQKNNLQNHIDEIHSELTHGGLGFRIWTKDWVVFFNEYGTGIYNTNGISTAHSWTYCKDDKFYTTIGQRPKGMFSALDKEIRRVMGREYQSCIHLAWSQQSYEDFRASMRG